MDLVRRDLADVPWDLLDKFEDRTVYQTPQWLRFLGESQGAEPVLCEVRSAGEGVGWFTGAIIHRARIPILGSPFQGWLSGPMGFNLRPGVDRGTALSALVDFAFKELKCMHLELVDGELTFDEARSARGEVATQETFEIDLRPEPDEIFMAMSSACRRAYRKSVKSGVKVEVADGDGFADEYYAQLSDVFAKQDLRPPYTIDCVRTLVKTVPPERLLLLRARHADGRSIATGIFPYHAGRAYFLGGASWRPDQRVRPNEALFWTAMRTLKERGVHTLDTGGGGDYKRKYGVSEVRRPAVRVSRYPGMLAARNAAEKVMWKLRTSKLPLRSGA